MILMTTDKYHDSRTCRVFLAHFVAFSFWLGMTISTTANSKQRQVVLVYVKQTAASRARILTASSVQQQHDAFISSKLSSK